MSPAAILRRLAIVHRDFTRAEHIARGLRYAGHLVSLVADEALPGTLESLSTVSPDVVIAVAPLDHPLSVTMAALRARLDRPVPVLGVLRRTEDASLLGPIDDEIVEPVEQAALVRRVNRLLDTWPERARLEREVQALTSLNRMAWAFSLASSPDTLFGQVARQSAEMLRAPKGLALLYHPESREMAGQAPGHGLRPEQVAKVRYAVDDARARWNFRVNGALLSNEARGDLRLIPELVTALGLRSLLAVPIRRGPQVLGVLAVGDRPQPFREPDLQMLEAAAHQASVAVENMQLHDQLKQANLQLQEFDRLKSEFVAMVAHDFRSPLMAIRGFAEVVLDDASIGADSRREFMRTIIGQTDDLARLAADTFLITQIEGAALQYHLTDIEVGSFLWDAVARISAERSSFNLDVPEGFPALRGDPEKLRQVMTNLLTNAIKYSPEGSAIHVRCREREPHTVVIEVEDHGLGIPPDQVGRLFQKFERVRTKEHMKVSGSGLGLYICRLIVEGHGGRIWVESEPGKGSTFKLQLPLAPPVGAEPPAPAAAPEAAAKDGTVSRS
jgi:signal transduction histidine kinase